jgi:hypothetical protein
VTQYVEHSGKNRMVENVVNKFFATANPVGAPKVLSRSCFNADQDMDTSAMVTHIHAHLIISRS